MDKNNLNYIKNDISFSNGNEVERLIYENEKRNYSAESTSLEPLSEEEIQDDDLQEEFISFEGYKILKSVLPNNIEKEIKTTSKRRKYDIEYNDLSFECPLSKIICFQMTVMNIIFLLITIFVFYEVLTYHIKLNDISIYIRFFEFYMALTIFELVILKFLTIRQKDNKRL